MRTLLSFTLLLLSLFTYAQPKTIVALSRNSRWDYNDKGAELSLVIQTPLFHENPLLFREDDWQNGIAPLGYGRSDNKTNVSFGADSTNKHITTYFYNTEAIFNHQSTAIDKMYLNIKSEDGFVVYLNGVEIARRNLSPLLRISSTKAQAANPGTSYEQIDITNFKYLLSPIAYLANAVAVEVHKADEKSASLTFDCEITYEINTTNPLIPAVTIGPYLNMGTPTSAIVRWYTNAALPTELSYGTNAQNLDKKYFDPKPTHEHEAKITGLNPNTQYHYAIDGIPSFLNLSNLQYFKTSPPIGQSKPTRMWVIGDFGVGLPMQHLVYTDYLRRNIGKSTDLWLWLGDNAYDAGTFAEYERNVFGIYGLTMRNHMIWPTAGNHDLKSCNTAAEQGAYFDFFSLPKNGEAGGVPSGKEAYYSFDYGNIHFICLESTDNDRMPSGPMVSWMEKDLKQNKQKWTIAFWHHPPYSKGSHDSDDEGQLIQMRENVLPLLEKYGVDLVLSGHSHCYERSYLLNGHYGKSETFDANSHLPQGMKTGKMSSSEQYTKPNVKVGKKGAIYSVVGSSGSPADFTGLDHPAHYYGSNINGSMIIEVNGDTLTATYNSILESPTAASDDFTIVKRSENLPCPIQKLLPADTLICQGQNLQLDAGNEYMNYLWSTGEESSKITVNKTGKYTLKAILFEGCEINDSIEVIVPSSGLTPIGTSYLCSGKTLSLKVDSNLSNISWSNGPSNTTAININQAGMYTVSATSPLGCLVNDTVNVILEQALNLAWEIPVNPAQVNLPLSFVDLTPGSLSRLWSFGDGGQSTDSIATHTYTALGEYNVVLNTKGFACEESRSSALKVDNINSVNALAYEKHLKINAKNQGFELNFLASTKNENIQIVAYNASGQKIQLKQSKLNDTDYLLDFTGLSSGIYYLQIKLNTQQIKVPLYWGK